MPDENITLEYNLDNLRDIADRMAQELQDFVDEAEQAGSSLPGVKSLVDEYNEFVRQTSWQKKLADDTDVLEIPAFLRRQAS